MSKIAKKIITNRNYLIVFGLIFILMVSTIVMYGINYKKNQLNKEKYSTEYLKYNEIFDLRLTENVRTYYSIYGIKSKHQNDENISIPDTVDGIPVVKIIDLNNDFSSWIKIKVINIGKNIEYIGTSTTDNGVLNHGTLGNNFLISSFCETIAINVAKENQVYSSIDGVLYNKDATILVKFPNKLSPDVEGKYTLRIRNTVKAIYKSAFCSNLAIGKIVFPDSLEEVGNDAFRGCTNLNEITFNSGLKLIGDDAFYKCSKLSIVNLNSGLEKIGSRVFAYCNIVDLYIPSTVNTFGASILTGNNSEYLVIYTESDNISYLESLNVFKNYTISSR